MGKTVKKVALIVGIAALAATGIGLVVTAGAAGGAILGGISAAANSIGLWTVAQIGIAGLTIGSMPDKPTSLEDSGANTRGRAFNDPDALGVFAFGTTTVPAVLVEAENERRGRERRNSFELQSPSQ